MAISTGLGLALGAGASILGGTLSASATKKAANKAADTSLAVADKNNALSREIYGQNQAALAPFMQRGNAAGDAIMELLGFPANTNTAPQPALAAYSGAQAPAFSGYNFEPPGYMLGSSMGQYQAPAGYYQTQAAPPQGAVTTYAPTGGAKSAFDRYRESTGYNFRQQEGMNALGSLYGGKGLFESGSAARSAIRYGQDYGSGEFGNYLGYLANQQGLGLSGASALAGVGQNYANNVSANNNSAGSAAANAALAAGSANGQLYGGIANALGGLAGGLSSSYGGGGGGAINFNAGAIRVPGWLGG